MSAGKFDEDKNCRFSRGLNHKAFDEICADNKLMILEEAYDEYFSQLDVLLLVNGENSGMHMDTGGPLVTDKESE
jgi:hypothetical protein